MNEQHTCSCHSCHEPKSSAISFEMRLGASFLIVVALWLLKVPQPVSIAGYVIALLLSGYEVLLSAGKNIIKGQVFDENFLMSIAAISAFAIGDMAEASAIMIFYGVGESLQNFAVNRSKKNIESLMDIRPDYANLKTDGGIVVISPTEAKLGDIFIVKPGERVPLDGTVVRGSSYIDTKSLTGESIPREVVQGGSVLSGCINVGGTVEARVDKIFADSTVAKILDLVQNASSKKAQSEKFITKFARVYTPIVVTAAVLVAILPPLLGFGTFSEWLYRAISFLIISCPCALVVSIPLGFFGGIGGAARQGILIKGGNYLDALAQMDTVVFDKTGTLTKGTFSISNIQPESEFSADQLIHMAALAESGSNHPIAKSIVSYYANPIEQNSDISERAGFGITAKTQFGTVRAGNAKLMQEVGIVVTEQNSPSTVVHVALDGRYVGAIFIQDEIKPSSKSAVQSLKHEGVQKTVLLSGDNARTAEHVAHELQIDEYYAEVLPHQKVEIFEKIAKSHTGKTAFVGDGINDAPVIARADIGIAMGQLGSDAAIEAADVVIMNDDVGKVATAIKIAKKTRLLVMQNIVFAIAAKVAIMALAFLGLSTIWLAIFADVGVALLALANAMRALSAVK